MGCMRASLKTTSPSVAKKEKVDLKIYVCFQVVEEIAGIPLKRPHMSEAVDTRNRLQPGQGLKHLCSQASAENALEQDTSVHLDRRSHAPTSPWKGCKPERTKSILDTDTSANIVEGNPVVFHLCPVYKQIYSW